MKAKEMFEALGYLPPKRKLFSERNNHIIAYFNIKEEKETKTVKRVFFHIEKKKYTSSGFIKNYEDILNIKECEFIHYHDCSIKLHQAITQQMIELGWLK